MSSLDLSLLYTPPTPFVVVRCRVLMYHIFESFIETLSQVLRAECETVPVGQIQLQWQHMRKAQRAADCTHKLSQYQSLGAPRLVRLSCHHSDVRQETPRSHPLLTLTIGSTHRNRGFTLLSTHCIASENQWPSHQHAMVRHAPFSAVHAIPSTLYRTIFCSNHAANLALSASCVQ